MGTAAQPILDSLDVPNDVKAQAWDDFHNSFTKPDFEKKFSALPLPQDAKAALWEARFGGADAPPAPAAPVDPSVLQPPPSADVAPPPAAPSAAPQGLIPPPPVQQPLPSGPSALAIPPKSIKPAPAPASNVGPLPPVAPVGAIQPNQPQGGPKLPTQTVPLKATPALNPNGAPPVSGTAPVPLPPQPAQAPPPSAEPPPDIYQQAKAVADTTPSFGTKLFSSKMGISPAQAAPLLDRLQAEGYLKRSVMNGRNGSKVVFHKVSGSPSPPESAASMRGTALPSVPASASDDLLNGQPTASVNLGGHPVVVQRQGSGQNFAIKDQSGQDLAGISIKKPGVGQEIKRLIGGQQ